eukprot:m.47854 g.47854  ORF g.47854 m.47854 type:complete len:681 (+) comp20605_c0_seq1:119-2161(+)
MMAQAKFREDQGSFITRGGVVLSSSSCMAMVVTFVLMIGIFHTFNYADPKAHMDNTDEMSMYSFRNRPLTGVRIPVFTRAKKISSGLQEQNLQNLNRHLVVINKSRSFWVSMFFPAGCVGTSGTGWQLLATHTLPSLPPAVSQYREVLLPFPTMAMQPWRNTTQTYRSVIRERPYPHSQHAKHCWKEIESVDSVTVGNNETPPTAKLIILFPAENVPSYVHELANGSCLYRDVPAKSEPGIKKVDHSLDAMMVHLQEQPAWKEDVCIKPQTPKKLPVDLSSYACGTFPIYVIPDKVEVILGAYHQSQNPLEGGSLIMSLLESPERLRELGISWQQPPPSVLKNGNGLHETLMNASSEHCAPFRFVVYAGSWNGAFPEVTQRLRAAVISLIWDKYKVVVSYSGPRLPSKAELKATKGAVLNYVTGTLYQCMGCWWFLSIAHAEAFRREIFSNSTHSTPSTIAVSNTVANIIIINRDGYSRHIDNATERLASIDTLLSTKGRHTQSTLIGDMGKLGAEQPEAMLNKTLVIAPHGQQATNFIYAPECAITIELFNHGSYHPMYGSMAITSGHIYGFHYDINGTSKSCETLLKKVPSHTGHTMDLHTSTMTWRDCVRGKPTTFNQQLLEDYISKVLLPVQEQCVSRGFASLSVPNLTKVEIDFEYGSAVRFIDLYAPGQPEFIS